jgi:ribosomal protein S24E
MFELSMKGESAYYRVKDLVKAGYKQADALLVESFYDSFGAGYGNGRKGLYADNSLTAVQKAMIDRALTGKSADYAHGEAMYELSVMSIENNSKAYTRAQGYVKGGITPDQALKIEQHYKEHRTKAAMLDYMRNVLKLNDEKINIVLVQLNWKPI